MVQVPAREVTPVIFQVTNEAGRRFQVRCIRRGDRYGLNGCLLQDRDDPVVEFTDVTPAGGPGPTPGREFVARFSARTLVDRDAGEDLWLFGRDVAWRLAPEQVRAVRRWVQSCLDGRSDRGE